MNIQLMARGKERAERRTMGYLREGVDAFREAIAAVTVLAFGTGQIGVHVIYIAGEDRPSVN